MARTKSTRLVVKVWRSVTLVIQVLVPLLIESILGKNLHVPNADKSLLSVHRIALDNHVFLEFHPYFFLIKDQATKNILYRGRCVRGLYPLIRELRRLNKQACGAIKLSSTRWHDRLGHASFSLVEKLLGKNKLPFVGERNIEAICDSCQ